MRFKDMMIMTKYFPNDVIKKIEDSGDNVLIPTKREATVFFFDIRGSTNIAETLPSDLFAGFLSDIMTDVVDLIYGNSGFVNKFLGDGLMALFGCPIRVENPCLQAVKAAVQIQNYLKTYNDVRPDYIKHPIKAGIGIASGTVFSGIIGSVRIKEFTVLGSSVNIASRLETLTKDLNRRIIIDQNTFNRVETVANWKKIPDVMLRGRKNPIDVYAL
jgi:adenylate cyclase